MNWANPLISEAQSMPKPYMAVDFFRYQMVPANQMKPCQSAVTFESRKLCLHKTMKLEFSKIFTLSGFSENFVFSDIKLCFFVNDRPKNMWFPRYQATCGHKSVFIQK